MKIEIGGIEFNVYQVFIEIDEEKLKKIIITEKNRIEEKIKEKLKEIKGNRILKGDIFIIYKEKIECSIYFETKDNFSSIIYNIEYPEIIIDEILKKFEEEYRIEKDIKVKKTLKWLIKKVYKAKSEIENDKRNKE